MAEGDFDARQITVTIGGETMAQIDAIGYSQSRSHELQRTLAAEAEEDQFVISSGEYTGTFSIKATSPSIPAMEDLFQNNKRFSVTITYADAEPRGSTTMTDCRLTTFGPADDYAESEMPMYEGEFEATDIEHS